MTRCHGSHNWQQKQHPGSAQAKAQGSIFNEINGIFRCLSSLLESCRTGKVNSCKDIGLFWSSPFRITKFVTFEGTVKLFLKLKRIKSSAKIKCSPRTESWHLLSLRTWERISDWEKYQKLTRENFWTVGQFCFAPINFLHLPCSTYMENKKNKQLTTKTPNL